jgi:hypothetical protein
MALIQVSINPVAAEAHLCDIGVRFPVISCILRLGTNRYLDDGQIEMDNSASEQR